MDAGGTTRSGSTPEGRLSALLLSASRCDLAEGGCIITMGSRAKEEVYIRLICTVGLGGKS